MPNQDQERCLAEQFFKAANIHVADLIMADKPDVIFDHSGKRIGLEVTDATPEEHVRAYRALKRMDWNGFTFPSNLQHREERRPTQELIEETIDIHSEWVDTGDATGRWAARIRERVIDKHRAFNHPDFQRFEENWLLISDLQNSPITHEPQLVTLKEFFRSAIAQFRPDSFFDKTCYHARTPFMCVHRESGRPQGGSRPPEPKALAKTARQIQPCPVSFDHSNQPPS